MSPKNHRICLFQALPALLLAVWYLFAVTGIDVHRDAEHGQTYVVSGLSGGDCERIHPDHHCHDADAEGECLSDEECCSDDFEAVLAVGGAQEAPALPVVSSFVLALPVAVADLPTLFSFRDVLRLHSPPPGGGDFLSRICVLRA